MLSREIRIPAEMAGEVFELAARLYAEHNEGYSVAELIEAGAAVQIPSEFIQSALVQLQTQQIESSSHLEASTTAQAGFRNILDDHRSDTNCTHHCRTNCESYAQKNFDW
jgi:hypothetical protein